MKHSQTRITERGWVFYDDTCGFCSRWVRIWRATLARRGLSIAPLQSPRARQGLPVSEEQWLDDLQLRLTAGEHIHGADVYRYVLRRIWYAYPIYLFSITPVFRRAFDWAYRRFAINRYRVSASCRFDGTHT